MSTIGKRVIYAGPVDGANTKPLHVEGVAVDAMLAGTLLKQSASGLETSDVDATVSGQQVLFADKDQMRSRSVDDAWTIDENMNAISPRSGEFLNVLVATAQALIVGTPLASNGDGTLKIATVATDAVIGHSDEAVTTTAAQLVRVRF